MAAVVGDIVVSLRADIANLRSDLDKARGEFKKTRESIKGDATSIRDTIEGLRHPLRGLSEATRGLGVAFGGVKSEAIQAGREILLGFGAAGPAGLAIAGLALLVSHFAEKSAEAGEAAKKAAEDAAAADAKEDAKLQDKADSLTKYVDQLERQARIQKTGGLNVAKSDSDAANAERLAKAQDKLAAAQGSLNSLNKSGGAGMSFGDFLEARKKGEQDITQAASEEAEVRKEIAADEVKFRSAQTKLLNAEAKEGHTDEILTGNDALRRRNEAAKQADEKRLRDIKEQQAFTSEVLKEYAKQQEEAQRKAIEEEDKRQRLLSEQRKVALEEQKKEAETHLHEAQSLAMSVGQTFTQFLVAPLQAGFKGLATFAEMAKQMLVGLIEKLVAAAIAAAVLMVLLPGSSFATNFGALAGIGQVIGTAVGAGHARGGYITGPGTGTSDSIPAWLSAGEFVMPADAVRHWGTGMMESMSSIGSMHMGNMSVNVQGNATLSTVHEIERAMRRVASERIGLMGPALASLVPGSARR